MRKKPQELFEGSVKYFVRNNMKQPVKLFRVLSTDAINRKREEVKQIKQTATKFKGFHNQRNCAG